jgi:NADH-quinone oxidoreductase subunit L
MLNWLWLVPALPLAGFFVLAVGGRTMSRRVIAAIGAGSVGVSALIAAVVAIRYIANPPASMAYVQTLWTWVSVGGFTPGVTLYLDPLAVVMMLVVIFVSFLIHIYSIEYMIDDEGYARFFAYMNLFVGSMLILVLADNLLFLYLGWEGVGLCSYLLIGFWYADPVNGRAAIKAFVVTRIGDTAMAIGLFLIFISLGTLGIQESMREAVTQWPVGTVLPVAAAALLLGGAVGKSGQLPLQVWLPDAMAGPTPVSALIHAATMVTAGVYLIARMHVIFELAPLVQTIVGVIGAITLLIAGLSALAQTDIKRALAYSTISQIGYMFLGLGAGAWGAAIFHFMTHAFFKALLFMAAGVVILSLHHEQDMRRMGGLRDKMPITFWTFVAGAASLAALPLVTAGFYSKDLILLNAWNASHGVPYLWLAGWAGAFITGIYAFRIVFMTFFGKPRGRHATPRKNWFLLGPLIVLAVLSLIAGFIEMPRTMGGGATFTRFLEPSLPVVETHRSSIALEISLQLITGFVALIGVGIAYLFYIRKPALAAALAENAAADRARRFLLGGWGFDWIYDWLFVRPFIFINRLNKGDFVDMFFNLLAAITEAGHALLAKTQTGRLRWYMAGVAAGAIAIVALVVWL